MDITLEMRRSAILEAIKGVRELVADEHWVDHKSEEVVEFPEGVKPAPLKKQCLLPG